MSANRIAALAATAVACLFSATAQASVITSLAGGTPLVMPVNNSTTNEGPDDFGFGTWTKTGDNPYGVFGYTSLYGFAGNGSWSGTPMAGLDDLNGTMTFAFSTPVKAILGEVNWGLVPGYSEAPSVTMAAYDAGGNLLESFTFGTFAHDDVAPGYYGFSESSAVISKFELSNGVVGIRNISVDFGSPAAAPEPTAWASH